MSAADGVMDDFPSSEEELEERLSRPPQQVVSMMRRLSGDLVILGAGGKMGPSLARMARRATEEAGVERRIIAVSRFNEPGSRMELEGWGIETISSDILLPGALEALPDAPNVIFMAGMKFGSKGQEPLTWAMNSFLPGLVARRYPASRIAAFSTGNVYGLVPSDSCGSRESDIPNPVGEYAQSCLGRERIFQHASLEQGTKTAIIRLNYACDLRYGVLVDIARQVMRGEPVDISINAFNLIWQADANALSLLCLELASSPAFIANVTSPEKLVTQDVAQYYADFYNNQCCLKGHDSEKALLSDASAFLEKLGYKPKKAVHMMNWVARWSLFNGKQLNKPTGFEKLDGNF